MGISFIQDAIFWLISSTWANWLLPTWLRAHASLWLHDFLKNKFLINAVVASSGGGVEDRFSFVVWKSLVRSRE